MDPRDELPEEFDSEEAAGEFWDMHDSTDYLDQLTPVSLDARLECRHFVVEVDEDVVGLLRQRAAAKHEPAQKVANDLLRQELAAG